VDEDLHRFIKWHIILVTSSPAEILSSKQILPDDWEDNFLFSW